MDKYDALRDHLTRQMGSRVTMAFHDIEKPVGTLPASARTHRAWWVNDSRVQTRAWRVAGWRVETIGQVAELVVFLRNSIDAAVPRSPQIENSKLASAAPAPPTPLNDALRKRRFSRFLIHLGSRHLKLGVGRYNVRPGAAGYTPIIATFGALAVPAITNSTTYLLKLYAF